MSKKNIPMLSFFISAFLFSFISSMEKNKNIKNNNSQKQESKKIRIIIEYSKLDFGEYFEKLPIEMIKKILDYIFCDSYIKKNINIKNIDLLLKTNDLKSINRTFFIFFINNYIDKFKDISKALGNELLTIADRKVYLDQDYWDNYNYALEEFFYPNDVDYAIDLIKAGADLNVRDYKGTAIICASWKGHKELIFELIKENIDLNQVDHEGDSALGCVSYFGYQDIASKLIKIGLKLDIQNKWGYTALIWSCQKGYRDISKELINAKADLNLKNQYGFTALICATRNGNKDIVKLLIDAGANLNLQNNQGDTALIVATINKFENIIGLLIDANADLNIKNNQGKTALDRATNYRVKNIITLALQKSNQNASNNTNNKRKLEDNNLESNKKFKKD